MPPSPPLSQHVWKEGATPSHLLLPQVASMRRIFSLLNELSFIIFSVPKAQGQVAILKLSSHRLRFPLLATQLARGDKYLIGQ